MGIAIGESKSGDKFQNLFVTTVLYIQKHKHRKRKHMLLHYQDYNDCTVTKGYRETTHTATGA